MKSPSVVFISETSILAWGYRVQFTTCLAKYPILMARTSNRLRSLHCRDLCCEADLDSELSERALLSTRAMVSCGSADDEESIYLHKLSPRSMNSREHCD